MEEIVRQLFADPAARTILLPGIMLALSIPFSAIGEGFKLIPKRICLRGNIPYILAAIGWAAAKVAYIKWPWLPELTQIPDDFASLIAGGGGLGAKAAHDHPFGQAVTGAGRRTSKKVVEKTVKIAQESGIWGPDE